MAISRMVWALVMAVVASSSVFAESKPFIAGFERFARHAEIDETTAGNLLARELSCTACHRADTFTLSPKHSLDLSNVGDRVQADWIKRFLASPQKEKPGTTMPNLFTGWPEQDKDNAIFALAAFLETQRQGFPEIKGSGRNPVPFEFWRKGNPETGKQLYHQIGCVACHDPDESYETVKVKPSQVDVLLEQLDPEELKELGLASKARRVESIPHAKLPEKYTHQSLTYFLLDPEKVRAPGRMPNMKLKAVEAADIAAYLMKSANPAEKLTPQKYPQTLIQQGKKLFVELQCANCHKATGIDDRTDAKPWAELKPESSNACWTKGKRGQPFFSLDEKQRTAVQTVIKNWSQHLPPRAHERLMQSLLQHNCLSCHERDNLGGVGRYRKPYFETVGNVDLGDEGRLPPPLTNVGEKLTRDAIKNVFRGKGDVRPHLKARMPLFAHNSLLPTIAFFSGADDYNRGQPDPFAEAKKLAPIGRQLMNQGCVQCHPFRGEALPGVVGVDLSGVTNRVNPHWFQGFLLKPNSKKPGTRMPTFFPNGQSQNKDLLEGDPNQQIAAMWAYLKDLDKQPLPQKIEEARSKDYELKPKDRPIVLRTFMKTAGTHAIAVGFPAGTHMAFDAELSRLAIAWNGRFLDAQGTWFSRLAPPADPLGKSPITWPRAFPFAVLKDAEQSWPVIDPNHLPAKFLGYRLDKDGVPTFLYEFSAAKITIEDRITADGENRLRRRLVLSRSGGPSDKQNVWFRAIVAPKIQRNNKDGSLTANGVTVKFLGEVRLMGELHQTKKHTELRIPLNQSREQTIEVTYEW